jgi:cephalosporin-C deacetylase-like acetyl esterase
MAVSTWYYDLQEMRGTLAHTNRNKIGMINNMGNTQKKGNGEKFLLIIFFCIAFIAIELNAQVKSLPINAGIALPPDEENLNVFQQWIRWNNPGSLLINHLTNQARDYYEIRDREIAKLKTRSEWMKRQAFVKDKIMELVGPFPERTPLNPKITGTIRKEGYRVDKIVFEAMPGYYVTGCIYVPDGIKGKIPAILNVCGHNPDAFRMAIYQVINYNLVKKGMIVFAIDPPGQAEHVQYFDKEKNTSSIGYSVIEHMYFGNQCFLTGSCAARYFIWEGISGIDYLISRKDVDPERIGVTGWSGGGQVTSYLSAFDGRVKVSIPCSGSIINRRLLETKGIQDAESFFIHGLANGITFEDLIEVRAPKPTLMTFTSRDEYLTIQSQQAAYSEAKVAYRALGNEDNLKVSEDDSKHWMTPKIRYDMYSFFMKHFNLSGDPSELEAEIIPAEELKVTPTGQILTSYGGDMIFDVNKRDGEKLITDLQRSRKDIGTHINNVRIRAKEISGFIDPAGETIQPFLNGRYQRDGYSVGKYAIMGEGDYAIPILLFLPDDNKDKHPALVYLHSKGKISEAKPGGEIEKLVRKGYVVAAADVIGIGETKNTVTNRQGTADAGSTAIIIGRSVVGLQAADIIRVVNYLKTCSQVDPVKIGAIGINEMCMPLMHAAAFDSSINNITLIGSLISYRSVVMNRIYKIGLTPVNKGPNMPYEIDYNWNIAGVLKGYDLPDLIGCIAPRKVAIKDLKDQALEPAAEELVKLELTFPLSVFSNKGASDNLKIFPSGESSADLVDWCFY